MRPPFAPSRVQSWNIGSREPGDSQLYISTGKEERLNGHSTRELNFAILILKGHAELTEGPRRPDILCLAECTCKSAEGQSEYNNATAPVRLLIYPNSLAHFDSLQY